MDRQPRGPRFGACPYAWPISAQQQGLIESLVAEGRASTGGGPFTCTRPLCIGRGVPGSWIAPGQSLSVGNLTSSYDASTGSRGTYGVSPAVTKHGAGRVVTVSLGGSLPGGTVSIQLPVFASVAVGAVNAGTYGSTSYTGTANPGATTVTITAAS